jgi:Ca-activated chloride channel family protein
MPDFGFDDWMDAQLRNVPVPRDLHARLASNRPQDSSPGSSDSSDSSDDLLDAELRNVPVPEGLGRRLRAIPRRRRAYSLWTAMAAAASVVVAVGAYLLTRSEASPQPQVAQKEPVAPLAGPVRTSTAQAASAVREEPRAVAAAPAPATPERQAPVTVRLGPANTAGNGDGPGDLPTAIRAVANVGSSLKGVVDAKLRARSALGSAGRIEPLPELDALEPPLARGVTPPRIRGYDMLFQLKHGEHPFVSPSEHKLLAVSRLPLTSRTTSFDLAAASTRAGHLPAPEEVRVEDFLAAQRYALPPAPNAPLALHIAGCPAPLKSAGPYLLQLAVQGGKPRDARHAPTRLVVVLETSTAMQYHARLQVVERALVRLAQRMAPEDRLTLIGFAETPRLLAEDVAPEAIEELLASGLLDEAGGWADFPAAAEAARDAVRAMPSKDARRVVFVTSGRGELPDENIERARDALRQLPRDAAWHVVQLSPQAVGSNVEELARSSRGKASVAGSTDELQAVLHEALTGRSLDAAAGVAVRITFNPKRVNSYRLLGHEAATLTGDAGDPLQVTLSAEQVATCMYELWLKPKGEGDIGLVEVVWRHPQNGQPGRIVRSVPISQLAESFSESPTWLQQGIVAARAAEFLRGSYYLPNSRRVDQLLDLAGEVDAQTAKTPEFRTLVELIERSAKLR